MDFFSHFFIGFLISALFFNYSSFDLIIYATIMSTIPDVDVFLRPLIKRKKNKYLLSHRGCSHSYIIGLLIAPIVGGIFFIIIKKNFFIITIVGIIFYSIHITFDLLSTQKIPVFYPLSKKEYGISLDNSVSGFLSIFSIVNLLTFIILYFFWPPTYFSSSIWIFTLSIYLIYFIYKAITRIWLTFKLPKNCEYIPGTLPFSYFVYETFTFDNLIVFRLTKKFQFRSKSKTIIENTIKKQTEEMFYFEKTKQICNEYSLFLKLKVIFPVIVQNKDTIEVTIFLPQCFFSGYAFFIRITFNKLNGKVIDIYKGVNLQPILAASYFSCILNKWITK